MLQPIFLNPEEVGDPLKLTELVRRALREASYAGPRGGNLVYVDAMDLPGALEVRGVYSVREGQVTVTLKVRKDGKERFTKVLKAPVADLAKLVPAILETVEGIR